MKERKTVGYIRSFRQNDCACKVQQTLIQEYCRRNGITCSNVYCDCGYRKNRHADEMWKAERIGLDTRRTRHIFPGWDDLMVAVTLGEVGTILIDQKLRLYSNKEQQEVVGRLCKRYDVQIIEVCHEEPPEAARLTKVAVYHFSDNPGVRTRITLNDIDSLYEYASHRQGWEVTGIFLDLTLSRRTRFEELMGCLADYDVVLVKSLYHIKRKMLSFLAASKLLKAEHIRIVSAEEGEFNYLEHVAERWLAEPLKVAVYDRYRSEYEEGIADIQKKRFDLFIENKTNEWDIVDSYVDIGNEQTQLQRMIENVKKYDIVLIDSYAKIGDTIIWIARVMNQINIPIYSLREGGIELGTVRG